MAAEKAIPGYAQGLSREKPVRSRAAFSLKGVIADEQDQRAQPVLGRLVQCLRKAVGMPVDFTETGRRANKGAGYGYPAHSSWSR